MSTEIKSKFIWDMSCFFFVTLTRIFRSDDCIPVLKIMSTRYHSTRSLGAPRLCPPLMVNLGFIAVMDQESDHCRSVAVEDVSRRT